MRDPAGGSESCVTNVHWISARRIACVQMLPREAGTMSRGAVQDRATARATYVLPRPTSSARRHPPCCACPRPVAWHGQQLHRPGELSVPPASRGFRNSVEGLRAIPPATSPPPPRTLRFFRGERRTADGWKLETKTASCRLAASLPPGTSPPSFEPWTFRRTADDWRREPERYIETQRRREFKLF